MANTQDSKAKTHRVDAYLSEEAYQAWQSGSAVSNNGFRSIYGSF